MTDTEIKSKVEAALTAFKELMLQLSMKLGPRRADAYRPALVAANQTLRFIADHLAQPPQS